MLSIAIDDYTVQDVATLDLDAVVAGESTIDTFDEPLYAKAEALTLAGDLRAAALVALVQVVSTFALQNDDSAEVFHPRIIFSGGQRSANVEDLEDGHFMMLERVRDAVVRPELLARIADVLWQRKSRNVTDARMALNAYLDSAIALDNARDWWHPIQRVTRAFAIARSIANGFRIDYDRVERWIVERARALAGIDPSYYSHHLMELLLTTTRSDDELSEFASQARNTATRALSEGDADRARRYYELEAKWNAKAKNMSASAVARVEAARTYALQARSQENPISRAALFAQAVQALRESGGDESEIKALRRELDDSQRQSVGEFATIGAGSDITAMVNFAAAEARGRSFPNAMERLASIHRPAKMLDIRERVERLIVETPLLSMIGSKRVDLSGRVTGVRPRMLGEDPVVREQATIAEMHEDAGRARYMAVDAFIEPFRREMLLEHRPCISDFALLLSDRPFVQRSRLEFFARGMHAGFYGNFLEASHILVPQIEEALRSLLARSGVIVYSQSAQGVQDVFNLNRVLETPELEKIFTPDYIFELNGVLVNRFGDNFRNGLSHGLLTPSETRGAASKYIWWLTWHLAFVLAYQPDSAGAPTNGSGANT